MKKSSKPSIVFSAVAAVAAVFCAQAGDETIDGKDYWRDDAGTLHQYLYVAPLNTKSNETTVLLAPSWGPNSILNRFGADFIQKLIDTGYNVVVRPHPQSYTSEKEMLDKLMAKFPETDKFSWNRDNDNFDILNKSDIMLSDFSGVIFDYALVYDKPVIYAPAEFDTSTYDAAWIDDELWTFKVLPTIGKELLEEDFSDMKKVIDECIASTEYQAGRDKAREETWMYPGEGAKRTVDYLENVLNRGSDSELKKD